MVVDAMGDGAQREALGRLQRERELAGRAVAARAADAADLAGLLQMLELDPALDGQQPAVTEGLDLAGFTDSVRRGGFAPRVWD
ncbi:hypothetical protein ACLF6K_06795 [Streptomyces xanthophaeus]|uniref:hypothetical protein n=1 Tax=Streptomyces xanthophaeus TaxID=67385 RepID=UPI00398FB8D8